MVSTSTASGPELLDERSPGGTPVHLPGPTTGPPDPGLADGVVVPSKTAPEAVRMAAGSFDSAAPHH